MTVGRQCGVHSDNSDWRHPQGCPDPVPLRRTTLACPSLGRSRKSPRSVRRPALWPDSSVGSRRSAGRRRTELPSSLRAEQEVSPAPARRPGQCRGQWREHSAANPAASVSVVRATTRCGPYQVVSAANAGGYISQRWRARRPPSRSVARHRPSRTAQHHRRDRLSPT